MNDYIKEIGWIKSEKYHNRESKQLQKDIKRLESGEPVDYIIGFKDFLGAKIDLSYRPLIPRLETEYWVELAIKQVREWKVEGSRRKILDMFAGSGCIGIALLKALPCSQVDFAEKNSEFIKQIKKNLQINKIDRKRYKVLKSNIFKNITKKYNYIFANPPYVPLKNISKVEKSVIKFEPKTAVFGGKDGLTIIKDFLRDARNHLKRDGIIYMEFDSGQKDAINQICQELKYKKIEFYKDQFDRFRYLRLEI